MGILDQDMQKVVQEQKLGFVATVCPDGTPNLSPKGTTTVWDDDHLAFLDICSPGTTENLQHNPAIEINVVDVFLRKGYRFKGTATVLDKGELFEQVLRDRQKKGLSPLKSLVLVKVERALPLISPAYDTGRTEQDILEQWQAYWSTLHGLS